MTGSPEYCPHCGTQITAISTTGPTTHLAAPCGHQIGGELRTAPGWSA